MFEDVVEIEPDDPRDKEMHFYYNREERINRAPENVKAYYRGEMKPVKGIKVFLLPQNRWLFFGLILFVGITWAYSGFNKTRSYASSNGINFELSAFAYDEEIYTTIELKRSKRSKEVKPLQVTADIFVIDNNNTVADKQTLSLIYQDGIEYIRTKFTDFDIMRVDVILNVNGDEKELSKPVKR